MNAFTVEDHVITCSLEGIPVATPAAWDYPGSTTAADFTVTDGASTHSGTTQTATLTIAIAKLGELEAAGSVSLDFKCKIGVGTGPTDVSAIQTVSIYKPGENIIFSVMEDMS